MKRFVVFLPVAALALTLVVAACSQAAPAPAPTAAPAAPAKAAEPTKPAAEPTKPAAVAQPTAAPAPKVAFPEKGKAITIIVPFSAGGGADISARILAAAMEKELGVPVQISNKPGASTQVGMTELVRAKPDGYTLAETPFASIFVTYLDATRKAPYTRKDFAPVANFVNIDNVIEVKADSPIKSIKDLVDAAKASPDKITIGDSGILGNTHLLPLRLGAETGAKFAFVHFGGNAEVTTAVLGGNVSAGCGSTEIIPMYKSGQLRVLATSGKEQSPFFPDVKTFVAQGYNVTNTYSIGLSAPAGTPKEVIDVLTNAVKKATASADVKEKFNTAAMAPAYMDPSQYDAYWTEYENQVKPLIELGKAEEKK